jgi:hypothetical protein
MTQRELRVANELFNTHKEISIFVSRMVLVVWAYSSIPAEFVEWILRSFWLHFPRLIAVVRRIVFRAFLRRRELAQHYLYVLRPCGGGGTRPSNRCADTGAAIHVNQTPSTSEIRQSVETRTGKDNSQLRVFIV